MTTLWAHNALIWMKMLEKAMEVVAKAIMASNQKEVVPKSFLQLLERKKTNI